MRLHTEHLHTVLLHTASVYTDRNFYTETLLHTEKLPHTASFWIQFFLHTASFYRKMFLNRETLLKQKRQFWNTFLGIFKNKIISTKIEKICWQIAIAAWMQPLQYDLRCAAAKDNSITHAAAAPSNLDAATTMRSAETELQNTIEIRATASEIAAPQPDLDAKAGKRRFWILKHFLKGFLKGTLLAPKLKKSADKWLSQPGCSHSNTIYDVQLQKTIVLRMQPRHQATLTQPFQCDLQRLSCKTQ